MSDIKNYIRMGKIGQSFTAEERVILLIDEIDKADSDFQDDSSSEDDQVSSDDGEEKCESHHDHGHSSDDRVIDLANFSRKDDWTESDCSHCSSESDEDHE